MENFELFATGLGVFISAIVVFCGSVWLLLTMVLGARLAYFVTASLTLGFVFIMGVVWSIGTPLGPVGQLPEWNPDAIAATADQLEFAAAESYPDDPWQAVDEDDADQVAKAGELESAVTDYLEGAIDDGTITNFTNPTAVAVVPELTRLLERDGVLFGAATIEPQEVTGEEPAGPPPNEGQVVAVMQFDPGDRSSTARQIAAGTFVLLVLHLIGLGRSERRARSVANGNGGAGG